MKVAIFAEASEKIGLGHLRRCAVLAEEFMQEGDQVEFLTQTEFANNWLKKNKPNIYPSNLEVTECDLAIIDSYTLTDDDITRIFLTKCHVGFDDLNKKRKIFSMQINPAVSFDPKIQIIDPAFKKAVRKTNRPEVKTILISLGAFSTPENIEKITLQVEKIFPSANIISTPKATKKKSMPELFQEADLVIASGGQTIFELAITGTPTIVLKHVDNQNANINFIRQLKILNFAKNNQELQLALIKLQSQHERNQQTELSRKTFDFKGAKRIVKSIKQRCIKQ
ncbi:hypothetical protein KKC94_01800 [Patescibacteria group bacterium]|nr:hypothetical protein [Patescibacteria group bacterium]